MPRDLSGTYSQPVGTEAVPGAIASSSAFNELVDDIGDELTASLTANGDKVWTGDQDAGTNTVTNLGAPSVASDAATKGYVDGLTGISAKLSAIDALTWAADKTMYFTGASTVGTSNFPAYGRTLASSDTAADARTTLELSALATAANIDNSNWSGADLTVANGGTGASDAAAARTNLGLDPYAGGNVANVSFPIGSYLMVNPGGITPSRNSTVVITLHSDGEQYEIAGGGATVTGTWHCRGHAGGSLLVQRTA